MFWTNTDKLLLYLVIDFVNTAIFGHIFSHGIKCYVPMNKLFPYLNNSYTVTSNCTYCYLVDHSIVTNESYNAVKTAKIHDCFRISAAKKRAVGGYDNSYYFSYTTPGFPLMSHTISSTSSHLDIKSSERRPPP